MIALNRRLVGSRSIDMRNAYRTPIKIGATTIMKRDANRLVAAVVEPVAPGTNGISPTLCRPPFNLICPKEGLVTIPFGRPVYKSAVTRGLYMPAISRRGFLGAAAAVTGAGVAGAALPAGDAQASPASPRPHVKHPRHGDIRDVRHVVILMQENRSFDHYYGSLRGVRGFGDRSTITLPGGL